MSTEKTLPADPTWYDASIDIEPLPHPMSYTTCPCDNLALLICITRTSSFVIGTSSTLSKSSSGIPGVPCFHIILLNFHLHLELLDGCYSYRRMSYGSYQNPTKNKHENIASISRSDEFLLLCWKNWNF